MAARPASIVGAALGTGGLRPGERVALFLGNHPDSLGAYLGTHLAGGVIVPVNTRYRRVELRHVFGDAGVRLCFADGEGRPERGRDDPALTVEKLEDFCREDLASYKEPRRVVFVDALPRDALGKTLKHRLREKLVE